MRHPTDVLVRAGELAAAGQSFVLATVTRVVRPASTQRGDRALITSDGELVGWIGGACSEPAVINEALRALADGQPRLLLIRKPGRTGPTAADTIVVESSCASEGEVEVLIEPELPAPVLALVGDSPAAATLVDLAERIGWRVESQISARADAIVVASMGRVDREAIRDALETSVGYIGLVASARRGGVTLDDLRREGLPDESTARIRCPAGLDLGPSSQEEIAVAVLAELVAWRHSQGTIDPLIRELTEAVDPVCGMTVAIGEATQSSRHGELAFYFCCGGCRTRFEADPRQYVAAGDRRR